MLIGLVSPLNTTVSWNPVGASRRGAALVVPPEPSTPCSPRNGAGGVGSAAATGATAIDVQSEATTKTAAAAAAKRLRPVDERLLTVAGPSSCRIATPIGVAHPTSPETSGHRTGFDPR